MIKKTSRIHMYALTILLAHSPAKAVDWERVTTYTCIGGAVAALAGIIWALCKPESDEQMLERIQKDYGTTNYHLMSYVTRYEESIHISPYNLQEDQLYTILNTVLNNTSIVTLEQDLHRSLDLMSRGQEEIQKRLRKHTQSELSPTLLALKTLADSLSETRNRIQKTLGDLFHAHGDYFKAVQYYHTLMSEYSPEMSILKNYQYNQEGICFYIKSIINNKGHSKSYPFLHYYETLVKKEKSLQYYVSKLSSHTYPQFLREIQQLLVCLEYIRSIIITSSEYTRDMLQKEQDAIRKAQQELAEQQQQLKRERERAQHEIRMAQIDLAIQQMAFKKECEEELSKLKKERQHLEYILNLL